CKTCEVACKQENRTPEGVRLIHVSEDGPKLVEGELQFVFRVNTCRHCDDPDCVGVCPEGAVRKRGDGIVVLDEQKCTGCGLCIDECPHDAISFDDDRGVARKCNLCYHRVDYGLLPACADNVCLAHCIYFGDPDEIREEIKAKRTSYVGHRKVGPHNRSIALKE
ncbi:MAG: 4Fe-4S dicluster domain-containing protein, partial [Desulfatiglandaceae bacterium]